MNIWLHIIPLSCLTPNCRRGIGFGFQWSSSRGLLVGALLSPLDFPSLGVSPARVWWGGHRVRTKILFIRMRKFEPSQTVIVPEAKAIISLQMVPLYASCGIAFQESPVSRRLQPGGDRSQPTLSPRRTPKLLSELTTEITN